VRSSYGLPIKTSFEQVNPDPKVWQKLAMAYGNDINRCHTIVCGLAETPFINGASLGELLSVIMAD